MEERLARALDEVLARVEDGQAISREWLREHHGPDADALAEILAMAGQLARPSAPIGNMLGPCRLLDELGRGGMGVVYLAEIVERFRDLEVGHRVAVKVIHDDLADRPSTQQRFMTEGVVGARLRHPNLLETHGSLRVAGPTGAALCLFMEPVSGTVLSAYRPQGPATPEDLCRLVGIEVARALVAVHGAGIIHRDVKPHNIMISEAHRAVLMDLGVAQVASTLDDAEFVGSPLYAAPEQLEANRHVDARADLFALGLTLVELALGERPDAGPPYELPEAYSPFFVEVVRCLTQPDPGERFDSARQLVDVLTSGERSGWWRRHPRHRVKLAAADASTASVHGRANEIASLEQDVAEVLAGEGIVRLLQGEAGIGKTRLVSEFLRRHPEIPLAKSGYEPDEVPVDQSGVPLAISSVPDLEAALGDEPRHVATRAWLRGERPDAANVDLTEIARTVDEALRARPRDPFLLWIDDMHGAPDEHVLVLRSVLACAKECGFLALCSGRPGTWVQELTGDAAADSAIHVAALTSEAVAALVRDAAHPRRLADSLVEAIVAQAAGSPLFALSTLWALGDELRQRPDETWGVTEHTRLDLSYALEDLLRERLRQRPAELELLRAAAVVGAEFTADDVAAALRAPPLRVIEALHALCHLPGLVRRGGGDRYKFDHHLLQEVLYRDIPMATRTSYHRALASHFRRKPRSDSVVAACHHSLRGADTDLRWSDLSAGLSHLRATHQLERAARLAREACDLPGLLVGSERLTVLALRAEILASTERQPDEHQMVLHEWFERAEEDPDPLWAIRAQTARCVHATNQWRHDRAIELANDALARLDRTDDDPHLRMRLLRTRAWALSSSGQVPAAEKDEQEATAIARTCSDRRERLIQQTRDAALAVNHGWAGAWDKIEAVVKEAEAFGDPHLMIQPLGFLGAAHRNVGELALALDGYRKAEACARETGARRPVRFLLARSAEILLLLGRMAEAERILRSALSESMDASDDREAAFQFAFLAQIRRDCGDTMGARRAVERSFALAPPEGPLIDTYLALAPIEALNGNFDVADDAIGEARRRPCSYAVDPALDSLIASGEAAISLGARDVALGWFREAQRRPRPNDHRPDVPLLIQAWLSAVADEPTDRLADTVEQHGAAWGVPAHMRLRYLLWCHDGVSEQLEEARSLLETLVSHAPPRYRPALVDNVPLYAAIRDGRPIGEIR